jgi:hypothetical protein
LEILVADGNEARRRGDRRGWRLAPGLCESALLADERRMDQVRDGRDQRPDRQLVGRLQPEENVTDGRMSARTT